MQRVKSNESLFSAVVGIMKMIFDVSSSVQKSRNKIANNHFKYMYIDFGRRIEILRK